MSQLSDTALVIAKMHVGQGENPPGSNWGHPVQDFLARVGIDEPAAWCMAFMYWCFDDANTQLNFSLKTLTPNPLTKTASVSHAWQVAYPKHKVKENPQVGDIFIMLFKSGGGHTGIIESIDSDGTLHTIEGNTDLRGSSEGTGVFRRQRHYSPPIMGFLRY